MKNTWKYDKKHKINAQQKLAIIYRIQLSLKELKKAAQFQSTLDINYN